MNSDLPQGVSKAWSPDLKERFEFFQSVRGYKLEVFSKSIEGVAFTFGRVNNTDELFDQLLAKGDGHEDVIDERIPYWAEIWPSALGLAGFILQNPDIFKGKKVLELGAGLGVAGLAAAKVGAEVTLTDYLPEPLEVADFLWQLNFGEPAQTAILDWRNPPEALRADVVIAADVMYEARAIQPVAQALTQLANPEGRAFVSEPGREVVRQWWQKMATEGKAIRRFSTEATDGISQKVTVYEWVLEKQ